MRKASITFILLVLLAAGAGYCIHWKWPAAADNIKVEELLPQQTIALVEITDLPRSLARWQQTAIHKITQEPQVAALLAKAGPLIPLNKEVERLARFQKFAPKKIFVAVTELEREDAPKVIAGFDFTGSRKDAAAFATDLQSDLNAQYPGWKQGSEQYGPCWIETFTRDEDTIAVALEGRWFFASNDLALLKTTIDRADGKIDPKTSLRDNLTYQYCLSKLPRDPDAIAYVGMKKVTPVLESVTRLFRDAKSFPNEEINKMRAVSAAMKFDGENLRDAIYICYKPGSAPQPLQALNSKACTSPGTALYFALRPNFENAPGIYDFLKFELFGAGEMVNNLQRSIESAGVGVDQFKEAFGAEAGVVMNWEKNSPTPGMVFTIDIRDEAKAQSLTQILVNKTPMQEIDGVKYYEWGPSWVWSSSSGHDANPYVALAGKTLLFGYNLDSVRGAVESAGANTARIDKSSDFQAASALVSIPTDSFAYIDTRTLFEKTYNAALPFIRATWTPGGSFEPPPAEVIGRHLGPIIFSQSTDANGCLMESTGPVTLTDMVVLGVGGEIRFFLYGIANTPG